MGTLVRVPLHGRRVGGWVVEDGVNPPAGVTLRPLAAVTGWGPPPELVTLTTWASWRWAGRRAAFLRTASPPRRVRALPPARPLRPPPGSPDRLEDDSLFATALEAGAAVLRLPPAADPLPAITAAASLGETLVLAPAVTAAA